MKNLAHEWVDTAHQFVILKRTWDGGSGFVVVRYLQVLYAVSENGRAALPAESNARKPYPWTGPGLLACAPEVMEEESARALFKRLVNEAHEFKESLGEW